METSQVPMDMKHERQLPAQHACGVDAEAVLCGVDVEAVSRVWRLLSLKHTVRTSPEAHAAATPRRSSTREAPRRGAGSSMDKGATTGKGRGSSVRCKHRSSQPSSLFSSSGLAVSTTAGTAGLSTSRQEILRINEDFTSLLWHHARPDTGAVQNALLSTDRQGSPPSRIFRSKDV